MSGFSKKDGVITDKQATKLVRDYLDSPRPAFRFKIGTEVRCLMTELKGRTQCVSLESNGNVRYSIHPVAKEDGSLPEGWTIDQAQLEFVGDGVSHLAQSLAPMNIPLLSKVRHAHNDFEGTVTAATWFLNGCLHYHVVSSTLHEGRPFSMEIDADQVVLVKAPMLAIPDKAPAEKPRGGPMTRSTRHG